MQKDLVWWSGHQTWWWYKRKRERGLDLHIYAFLGSHDQFTRFKSMSTTAATATVLKNVIVLDVHVELDSEYRTYAVTFPIQVRF